MPKIKPERVVSAVALSYLVLIPAAVAFLYIRMRDVESAVDQMWDEQMQQNRKKLTDKIPVPGIFSRNERENAKI